MFLMVERDVGCSGLHCMCSQFVCTPSVQLCALATLPIPAVLSAALLVLHASLVVVEDVQLY